MQKTFDSKNERFLSRLAEDFRVGPADIAAMIDLFHREMERGLAGKQSSLKMIPAFVGRPTGAEQGRFLALDLGGTNLRVLEATLEGNGKTRIEAANRFAIPPALMRADGERIFDFIADSVKASFAGLKTDMQRPCELAFTFSFPVDQLSIASGKLIHWTKGFTAAGVEGRDVAGLLSEALKRKGLGCIRVVALTNDTAGTLAAGSYADPACDTGVILGTGTNACYAERIDRIGRLAHLASSAGEMIINTEWGNFDKVPRNVYDLALDAASSNPGQQRLEKMVSGMYTGELARLVIVEMMRQGLIFPGADPVVFSTACALTAEHMAIVAQGGDFPASFGLGKVSAANKTRACEIFRIVSGRSARLAAAAIATVVLWMDKNLDHRHTIAIDGSLFQKYPGFKDAMRSCLKELFKDRAARITFLPVQDGSGIGAAIIAAVAASARAPSGSPADPHARFGHGG